MAGPPRVPLSQAITEFGPEALKKAFTAAQRALSAVVSELRTSDDRWKNKAWVAQFMLAGGKDGKEPAGMDRLRRAQAAVRSAELSLINDLLARLAPQGDLVAFARTNRITGELTLANAIAFEGMVYVHGSNPDKPPNAQFDFRKGTVFFWREGLTLYDVRIARRAATASSDAPKRPGGRPEHPLKGTVRAYFEKARTDRGLGFLTTMKSRDREKWMHERLKGKTLPKPTTFRNWWKEWLNEQSR